jgi:hypothetical protein
MITSGRSRKRGSVESVHTKYDQERREGKADEFEDLKNYEISYRGKNGGARE